MDNVVSTESQTNKIIQLGSLEEDCDSYYYNLDLIFIVLAIILIG